MGLNNLNKTSPANYELIFSMLPFQDEIDESRKLVLNIHNTIIPSVTLDMEEQHWQGATRKVLAGGISYEMWFLTFLVDSKFDNWYKLFNWINQIHNNKDRFVRSPKEFQTDAGLIVTDNYGHKVLEVTFINTWLTYVGEVNLGYREGSEVLEATANLVYDRYEVRRSLDNS